MSAGPILVVGATGRQGGAVVRELLRRGRPVRALTRDPTSPAALAIAALGAELAEGDLARPPSLAAAVRGVGGVFGVTEFWEHGHDAEVRHGTALIDAAAAAGVGHFVLSSVGGTDRTEGLGIRHFDSKRTLERHLAATALSWTVVRPVTFFDNFVSARFRRSIRRGVFSFCITPDRPFQMVAVADLAVLVGHAFASPSDFAGRAIEVASDGFTMREMVAALGRAVGRPVRYRYLGPAPQRVVSAYVRLTGTQGRYKVGPSLIAQFEWNNGDPLGGWRADLDALRRLNPQLTTLDGWARSVDWRA